MHHDSNETNESVREAIRRAPPALKKWVAGILAACVCLIVGNAGYKHWRIQQEQEKLEAEAKAGPHVKVATVMTTSGERSIDLLGEAKAFSSVVLYAKVSGYLKEMKVDKGDRVKKGQILAIIESPETIRSLEGAQADAKNKAGIRTRMEALYQQKLISDQEFDQSVSDEKLAKSRLDNLAVQRDYQSVRAPFDGTITARFADPGALVQNAANSQTSALPVASISAVDRLRVYVYIDQKDASFVKAGREAMVHLPERSDVAIHAKVARVSGELDQKSHTLLAEVDIDNKDGAIVAGSFVQVSIVVETPKQLEIPAEALVIQSGKTMVPVVSAENVMTFKEVQIADNDGKKVRVSSGLEAGDTVALNLGNSVASGSHVRPMSPDVDSKKQATSAKAGHQESSSVAK